MHRWNQHSVDLHGDDHKQPVPPRPLVAPGPESSNNNNPPSWVDGAGPRLLGRFEIDYIARTARTS